MQAAQQAIQKIVDLIVNPAIYVVFSLGLLIFVYGVVEFLIALSKGGETKEGKSHMLWGVVGMFIMVSVFGIIHLLNSTFGFGLGRGGSYNPNMSAFDSIRSPSLGQ